LLGNAIRLAFKRIVNLSDSELRLQDASHGQQVE